MSRCVLKVNDLSFSYGATPVLRKIKLDVRAGEYLSVVGANGCGKSTLVKLILGLIPDKTNQVKLLTKRVAYIAQHKSSSYENFPITATELLWSYAHLLRVDQATEKIRVLLAQMKLEPYRDHLVSTLSGGQYQKLLIARSLLGEPELLILDEPSTGVDRASQAEIYRIIKKLSCERQMSVIAVEHNLQAAVDNSTMIFHIKDGTGHLCTPAQYLAEVKKEKYAAI